MGMEVSKVVNSMTTGMKILRKSICFFVLEQSRKNVSVEKQKSSALTNGSPEARSPSGRAQPKINREAFLSSLFLPGNTTSVDLL